MPVNAPRRRPATSAPANLYDAALKAEECRHTERLAELKRIRSRLALLEEFMPALHAAGVSLRVDDLQDWGGQRLYIGNPGMDPERNAVVERVLRQQGMSEESLTPCTLGGYSVNLAKGRLTVYVHVDAHRIKAAEGGKCV
ncbi:hypothetical protein C8245_13875 [Paracidovorax avenae]|uniref:hypothetical protein n=1 Tax=Paracidovorax avenae TaxID=80867 RepID=UPI000D219701|nr:hypothetical protein [Paracidovorax avenae]AVS66623.1 hypothetical protein C8245_13875 [Paracidovorax avenae]